MHDYRRQERQRNRNSFCRPRIVTSASGSPAKPLSFANNRPMRPPQWKLSRPRPET